ELVTLGTLRQQPVLRIDMNPEARAAYVVIHNVEQLRKNEAQHCFVAAELEIAIDGVEKPQRRVGGVVEAVPLTLRKQVRNEPVTNRVRKRAEDVRCLDV